MWSIVGGWLLDNLGGKALVVLVGVGIAAGYMWLNYQMNGLQQELSMANNKIVVLQNELVEQRVDLNREILEQVNDVRNEMVKIKVVKKADVKVGKVADPVDALKITF